MTEALFCLSVGFVAYVFYVLVDEQMGVKAGVPQQPVVSVKPPRANSPRKVTTMSKAKVAEKGSGKSPKVSSDPILAYLSKNGLTSVAKLSKELPESRKAIEDRIEQLVQEGKLIQTIVRRAKTVAIKS